MRDLGVTADEHSSAAFWHRSAWTICGSSQNC